MPVFYFSSDLCEISFWSAGGGSAMYLRLRADYPKVPRLDSRAWLPVLRLAQVPGCPRLRSFSSGLLFHVFFCVRCLVPGLDCVVSPLFVFLLFSLQGSSTFVTLICLCLLIPQCVIVLTVVTPWFLFSARVFSTSCWRWLCWCQPFPDQRRGLSVFQTAQLRLRPG